MDLRIADKFDGLFLAEKPSEDNPEYYKWHHLGLGTLTVERYTPVVSQCELPTPNGIASKERYFK